MNALPTAFATRAPTDLRPNSVLIKIGVSNEDRRTGPAARLDN